MAALTVGIAVFEEYEGLYFTMQAMRLYQDLTDVEFLVIDNGANDHIAWLVQGIPNARYVRYFDVQGSAAPRERIFQEATGDVVLCCDPHVLLEAGALVNLKRYFHDHPDTRDLLQGPMIIDRDQRLVTHHEPVWEWQTWGRWGATDPRGVDLRGAPFEIPMQGLGVFACRREAWPGFNPDFRGFGGEEGYIHEKFRQHGGKVLCLPFLRWSHRFGRPRGTRYHISVEQRFRNYVIGHHELGLDLAPLIEHFAPFSNREQLLSMISTISAEADASAARRAAPAPQTGTAPEPAAIEPVVVPAPAAPPATPRPAPVVNYPDAGVSAPAVIRRTAQPLVSCICPTYNRVPDRQWLLEEAVASFLKQDYPNKELIILNDCAGQVLICDEPQVRVVNVPKRLPTLGDKRNAGVLLSRGEIIAPWDDDDISLPWRLSYSVENMGDADFYNPRRYWLMNSTGIHDDHEMQNGHNLALYSRAGWERVGRNPSMTFAEDVEMVRRLESTLENVRSEVRGTTSIEQADWFYVYRWGVSPTHLSSNGNADLWTEIDKDPIARGRFTLNPQWRIDYVAETRALIARAAVGR